MRDQSQSPPGRPTVPTAHSYDSSRNPSCQPARRSSSATQHSHESPHHEARKRGVGQRSRQDSRLRDSPPYCFPPRSKTWEKRGDGDPRLKTCAGCGKSFYPKHGNQRYCRPDHRGTGRKLGFTPALNLAPRFCDHCGGEFKPKVANQRFCSLRCQRLGRSRLERQLYRRQGARRARLRPMVATGRVRCARGAACKYAVAGVGGLIAPGQAWDLGHPDGESVGGPEHAVCNRGAPSRRSAA